MWYWYAWRSSVFIVHPRDKTPQTIFFCRDGIKIEVIGLGYTIFDTILSSVIFRIRRWIHRLAMQYSRHNKMWDACNVRDTQESNQFCMILIHFYIFLSFFLLEFLYFIFISCFVLFVHIFKKTDYNFDALISLEAHRHAHIFYQIDLDDKCTSSLLRFLCHCCVTYCDVIADLMSRSRLVENDAGRIDKTYAFWNASEEQKIWYPDLFCIHRCHR